MSESKKYDSIQGEIIHEYDGIQEADNRLPRWWLMTLFAAMLFSIGYWFYYQEFAVGLGPTQAYYAEQAELAEKAGVDPTDGELLAAVDGPLLALGQKTFTATCVPCHEAQGQGKIGPNLTDASWLHGGSPSAIFKTIRDGAPAKGMPSWGPGLGRAGVLQVTAFVLSLRNKNVPGRPAEGEPYDPTAASPAAPPAEATNVVPNAAAPAEATNVAPDPVLAAPIKP